MKYTTLGKTGLKISRMGFGESPSRELTRKVLRN